VTTRSLAEAGLSDCVDAQIDCMPGFGTFLLTIGLGAVAVFIGIPLAISATVSIASSSQDTTRRVAWIATVWLVPVLGALAWFYSAARKPHPTHPRKP
jgi:cytochrome bd-type quinol oxidase subunit 2